MYDYSQQLKVSLIIAPKLARTITQSNNCSLHIARKIEIKNQNFPETIESLLSKDLKLL